MSSPIPKQATPWRSSTWLGRNGLQEGLSEPIALLLDEPVETISRANQAGFRCFTEVEALQEYVIEEILEHEAAVD
ncbi:MAG: hypothetical protein M5U09_02710 [Gammaproteobacteria bacterium]|nr:hypothetical protein [Gammaproteobacteria bacterium]